MWLSPICKILSCELSIAAGKRVLPKVVKVSAAMATTPFFLTATMVVMFLILLVFSNINTDVIQRSSTLQQ